MLNFDFGYYTVCKKISYEIYMKIFRHKGTDACHLLSNDSKKEMCVCVCVCVCVCSEREFDTANGAKCKQLVNMDKGYVTLFTFLATFKFKIVSNKKRQKNLHWAY